MCTCPISARVGLEKQRLREWYGMKQLVTELDPLWAIVGVRGRINARLLALQFLWSLKSLEISKGCSWEGKMNVDKSEGKLAPTRTNWTLPLCATHASLGAGSPCRRRWCFLLWGNAGTWLRIWRRWGGAGGPVGLGASPHCTSWASRSATVWAVPPCLVPCTNLQSINMEAPSLAQIFYVWPYPTQNQTEKEMLRKVISALLTWHSTKPRCVFA